jgi:hypothetical protein
VDAGKHVRGASALAPTTDVCSALLDGTPVHGVGGREATLLQGGRRTVSAQELLARLVDELPAPERVEPFAFLEDELLPLTITPVEPAAFVLVCVQAARGPHGPQN